MAPASTSPLDATAVGEGQIRFDTSIGSSLQQANNLSLTVAGAEGNVMGLLSQLGNRTGLVTALPENPLGRKVVNEYRAAGIDTTGIIWRERGRVALYFVERASPPVPSRVIYDREGSCFWNLQPDDVDWDYLNSSRLIHLTGITACLNDNLHAVLVTAARRAAGAAQKVSVDVNYRSQLASPAQARARLEPLLESADVISCSRRDASLLFGIDGEAAEVARRLGDMFEPDATLVSDGGRSAAVCSGGEVLRAQPPQTSVVDRVGAGDALIAGFLHGYLHDDPKLGLELGVAAAALTLTRFGDQVQISLGELLELSAAFGNDIVR